MQLSANASQSLRPRRCNSVGIGHGDVVAVPLPNIPEFMICWFAINRARRGDADVHTPYGVRELEHLLAHSGAKACIAMARTRDRSPADEIAVLRGNACPPCNSSSRSAARLQAP